MNEKEKEQCIQILLKNRDALSLLGEVGLGTHLHEARIRPKADSVPFMMKPVRISMKEVAVVRNELDILSLLDRL